MTVAPHGRRVLMLLTDAWGGHGGIALYNRDVIRAMCLDPTIAEVVALPRVAQLPISEGLPAKLDYDLSALGGRVAYLRALVRAMRRGRYDLVYCAHLNLLPFARAAATILDKPLVLAVYGIDAWEPSRRLWSRLVVRSADHVLSISQVTLDRFRTWAPYPDAATTLMPNAIHLDEFSPGPKDPGLEARYGLAGRKVLMTFGRMAGIRRYKGFHAVLDRLPAIVERRPDIVYLIAGAGLGRVELEKKARDLGMTDHVVFTGWVSEEEKAAHYRLADLYVMPSRGEGFGFVLLEAMACGIPAIGSTRDGTREAMRDGLLGPIVDPLDQDAVVEAVIAGLDRPRGVPAGLDYFAFPAFVERFAAMIGPRADVTVRSALIWGVGGQDGALLARLLLEKGYRVSGTTRSAATPPNLVKLAIAGGVAMQRLDPVDGDGVERVIAEVVPDEIYYLAAQSSVGRSFAEPEATFGAAVTGLGNVFGAATRFAPSTRIFNAASGECFGDCAADSPACETTAFDPRSPYAEAKAAGHRLVEQHRAKSMWAASAFLFPHESPLRPVDFVTGKIVAAVRRIADGDRAPLELGDLSVVRDWGWAPDYVEAMWRMLQLDSPADLILATGTSISLEAFVAAAFAEAGLDWRDHVVSSPQLRRPSEVAQQHADPSLALDLIGWRAGLAGEAVAARLVRDAPTSSAA